MENEIKRRFVAPGTYEIEDNSWKKKFLEKLGKRVPHCDHIPTGIFHKPPSPYLSFDLDFRRLDYADFNPKLGKILRRARVASPHLITYTYSSSIYLLIPSEWTEENGSYLNETIAPQSKDFENYYFLAEDLSFGFIGAVNGMKAHFFGKPLLDIINTNRPLWPEFWRQRAARVT